MSGNFDDLQSTTCAAGHPTFGTAGNLGCGSCVATMTTTPDMVVVVKDFLLLRLPLLLFLLAVAAVFVTVPLAAALMLGF